LKRSKSIKILISAILLLLTAWIAVPKVYVHELFHHNHEVSKISEQAQFQSEKSTEDCEFENYNKPVYFHIFTFISKFVPVKPRNAQEISQNDPQLTAVSLLISLLRAPPASE
jgi:hypothetical protein